MVKRGGLMRRGLLLFLLAAALLTVPVFADFGPKPQLTVQVENAPEELYYLDILKEGSLNPAALDAAGGPLRLGGQPLLLPAGAVPGGAGVENRGQNIFIKLFHKVSRKEKFPLREMRTSKKGWF